MSKKLNLALIKEDIKKYDEKKRIELSNDTYTYIYPNFAPSKLSEMLQEVLSDKSRAEEAGINFSNINNLDWLFFNTIRYFADVAIPNDIKKKVQAFLMLRDSDYYTEILEAFPEKSMNKISEALDKVNKILENMNNYNSTQLKAVVNNVVVNSNDEESE